MVMAVSTACLASAPGTAVAGDDPPTSTTPPPPPVTTTVTGEGLLANTGRTSELISIVTGSPAGGDASGGEGTDSSHVAPAAGGGPGGDIICSVTPVAEPAAVAAIVAAVEAGQVPVHPELPVFDLQTPGSPAGMIPPSMQQYLQNRSDGPYLRHFVDCPDGVPDDYRWLRVTASGQTVIAQPEPEDFVPALYERVVQRLPTPVPRVAPADWLPDRWTFVNNPTFFWLDQAQGQWATVTATAGVPGLTVTAQAVPERFVVHPGDGSRVVCQGAPPAYDRNRHSPDDFRGCAHQYVDSSAMAPNGETFPLTVDIVWHASWSATNGESGDLGYVSTTSEVRWLPVAEIQAVLRE